MKILIDSGADPTITNTAGHDAVYEAELNDKKEVVEWVLKESEGLEEGIGGPADAEEGVDESMEDEEPEQRTEEDVAEEEAIRAKLHDLGVDRGMKGT